MSIKKLQKNNAGFTLIEVMIATALFVAVAVVCLSAILASNTAYKKTEDMRAITDNLDFAMQDMSRNLQIGYNYVSSGNPSPSITFMPFNSELDGQPLSTGTTSEQGYFLCPVIPVQTLSNGDVVAALYKAENGAENDTNCRTELAEGNLTQLTDPRIQIDLSKSGFYIENVKEQPVATILLSGQIVTKNLTSPFAIQTSVSQRLLNSQ